MLGWFKELIIAEKWNSIDETLQKADYIPILWNINKYMMNARNVMSPQHPANFKWLSMEKDDF